MISPSCCPLRPHEPERPDPPPRSRPPNSYTTSRDTTGDAMERRAPCSPTASCLDVSRSAHRSWPAPFWMQAITIDGLRAVQEPLPCPRQRGLHTPVDAVEIVEQRAQGPVDRLLVQRQGWILHQGQPPPLPATGMSTVRQVRRHIDLPPPARRFPSSMPVRLDTASSPPPDRAGCGASPAASSPQPLAAAFFPAALPLPRASKKPAAFGPSLRFGPAIGAGCGPAARHAFGATRPQSGGREMRRTSPWRRSAPSSSPRTPLRGHARHPHRPGPR
jgi:hypothetical protein